MNEHSLSYLWLFKKTIGNTGFEQVTARLLRDVSMLNDGREHQCNRPVIAD